MPGTWDRIKAALRREHADAKVLADDLTAAGNHALDDREWELNATSEEKLAREQQHIAASDADYEALKRQLGS